MRKEQTMPIRLVITTYAKPGKGAELAQAMADRCRAVQREPGCQQFEVLQSKPCHDILSVSGYFRRLNADTRRTICLFLR